MKTTLKLTLLFGLFITFSDGLLAQKSNNSKTDPKSKSNTKTVKSNTFLFNTEAKRFVLGFQIGPTLFHGDADKIKLGYAGGLNLRYNFSHVFAMRAVANIGQIGGEVSEPQAMNMSYFRFTDKILEYQAQMILTIGNISFFHRKSNWNAYSVAGVGQVRNNSHVDYQVETTQQTGTLDYKKTHICFTFGAGIKYNVSKSIDLGLEYGMRWVRSDSLDILNAPIHRNRKFDFYSVPQVVLNIKLGKSGKEHLDWINPIASVYEDITRIEDKIDKLDKDSDGDGVADRFDKEENTAPGAKVWGSGEAVDLDADGVPDVNDQEPSSPAGAKVDPNTGIAEDEDNDGVPDVLDLSPNTSTEYLVNHQGIPIISKEASTNINMGGGAGGGSGVSFLPAVFFATAVDEPYPTHLSDLQGVALALKNNPGIKIEIIGNADVRNSDDYNLRLAQRRADNVKKILVQFGADESRLITKTNGERVPITTGSSAMALQANRRVQFFIVK